MTQAFPVNFRGYNIGDSLSLQYKAVWSLVTKSSRQGFRNLICVHYRCLRMRVRWLLAVQQSRWEMRAIRQVHSNPKGLTFASKLVFKVCPCYYFSAFFTIDISTAYISSAKLSQSTPQ